MVKEDSSSRSTVVNISSSDVPKDYVTWSTFNTVFLNSCCLGFLAYVFSVKVSVLAVGVMGQEGVCGAEALPAQRAPGICTALCLCMRDPLCLVSGMYLCLASVDCVYST